MIIYIDYDKRTVRYTHKRKSIEKKCTRMRLFFLLQYLFTHTSVTASYSTRHGMSFTLNKNARYVSK